jgi:Na+:H+ antiporter, NhaA family
MPLFAFGNAGISLAGPSQHSDVTMGAALGLTIGKPAGIVAATAAALATGRATKPTGVTMATLHGCAWLGGVG